MSAPSRRSILGGAIAGSALSAAAARPSVGFPVERVFAGLTLIRGPVNSAIFERNGKLLVIDSGSLSSRELGGVPQWLLFTHHHRDQAIGADKLVVAGARAIAPDAEAHLFERAPEVWEKADSVIYHRYKFRPHLFTLYNAVPLAKRVRDRDVHEWEGLRFEVIDTPGQTDGSVTYFVETEGCRIAFTGDLIYSPGQIQNMYSLQKTWPGMPGGYWGFGGAVPDLKASLRRVLDRSPDMLIPSHGKPMRDPRKAVKELNHNLDMVMENYLTTTAWRTFFKQVLPPEAEPRMLQPMSKPNYPSWFRDIAVTTKAIVAEDKSIFLFDCGFSAPVSKLAELQKNGEIGRIEKLWITHYHDDHVDCVNRIKERFGAELYVQEEMADIIEHPDAYNMPCLSREPARVDRVLRDGEVFAWKGFRMTSYYFPGQTLYHAALLVEKGGVRLLLTGDSFGNWGIDDYCSENRCFVGSGRGFEKCLELLLRLKPDMLVNAHSGTIRFSEDYVLKTLEVFRQREMIYRKLLPWDNPNFGLDPFWLRAYPYKQSALPGSRVELEVRVLNHCDQTRMVQASLVLPDGWRPVVVSGTSRLAAGQEGRIRLSAIAPETRNPRRYVLGLSAVFNGTPVGEVAESIVDLLN